MRDSLQQIGKGHATHEQYVTPITSPKTNMSSNVHYSGDDGLALHLTKSGIPMERGATSTLDSHVMELEKVRSRA